MSKLTVKRDATAKKKPRGRPFTGKDDPRNGPGAPKRGQSWKEIIHEIGEMTPDEARQICAQLFTKVNLHDEVTLKQAVVMRVYAALLFDPQPGLLNAFMERVEGKVAQPITQMTDEQLREYVAAAIGIDLSGVDGSETARLDIVETSQADSMAE